MTSTGDAISDVWLGTARQYHPQLTEKALIDLVNGLEVVGDHLRCHDKSGPMLARIWQTLTGRTEREQYLIDINLKTGLDSVTAWLTDMQAFHAKSDLALAIVAERLVETRAEVNVQLAAVVAQIDKTVEQVDSQLEKITVRVDEIEINIRANEHLELVIARAEEQFSRRLSPLAAVFAAVDELWWGDFGRYCRLKGEAESRNLVDIGRRKLAASFAKRFGLSAQQIFDIEELLHPLSTMVEDERDLIAFLANHGTSDRTPLMSMIAVVANGQGTEPAPSALPLALSLSGVTQRLFREARSATVGIWR